MTRKMPAKRKTKAEQEPKEELSEDIKSWLGSVGSDGSVLVKIHREAPAYDEDGNEIKGFLAQVDEVADLDETYLKKRFGGGKYQIKLINADTGRYMASRRIRVAGPPKMTNGKSNGTTATPVAAPVHEPNTELINRAMDATREQAAAERERAQRMEERIFAGTQNKDSDKMFDLFREVMNLSSQGQEKLANALRESRDRPNESSELLKIMAEGKNAELASVNERHRAELAAAREFHKQEMLTVENRHDRELAAIREDHKRTIDYLKTTYEGRIQTVERSSDNQIQLLKLQLETANGQIKHLNNELQALRNKKDKTASENILEMVAIKEGLDRLGSSGDDDPKETWEKVLDKLGDNPLVAGIGKRLSGAGMPQPPPQLPPQQPQAPQVPPEPAGPSREAVLQAIRYTENAIEARNSTPEGFARSIRTMIPVELLNQLVSSGADAFADEVAQHMPHSVICTMAGRQFLRGVVAALSGDGEPQTSAPETEQKLQ